MNRYVLAASTLSTAVGLALAMQTAPARAAEGMMGHEEMEKMMKEGDAQVAAGKMQKCYGINKVAKNDCGGGAISCAGQSTKARDPKAYVMLPTGDCSKIQGGRLKAS